MHVGLAYANDKQYSSIKVGISEYSYIMQTKMSIHHKTKFSHIFPDCSMKSISRVVGSARKSEESSLARQ
jgi:hypothetical protein